MIDALVGTIYRLEASYSVIAASRGRHTRGTGLPLPLFQCERILTVVKLNMSIRHASHQHEHQRTLNPLSNNDENLKHSAFLQRRVLRSIVDIEQKLHSSLFNQQRLVFHCSGFRVNSKCSLRRRQRFPLHQQHVRFSQNAKDARISFVD